MSASTILDVKRLNAFYGSSQVLFGVDLSVGQGQCVALLGRNGAGKSTTMKATAGLLPRTTAVIALLGRDSTRENPHRIAQAGLAYVPEDRQVFPEHTV